MPFYFDQPEINGANRRGPVPDQPIIGGRVGRSPMALTYPIPGTWEHCNRCGLLSSLITVAVGVVPWCNRHEDARNALVPADEFVLCPPCVELVLDFIEHPTTTEATG